MFHSRSASFGSYLIGFLISLVLSLGAFALVVYHSLNDQCLIISVVVLALIQLLVQVICFFRLSAQAEERWNLITFIFTLLIMLIVVSGSLWIMYNLNYNMVQ